MGKRGSLNMERKGCESIGCWTHYVTLKFDLTYDLDLDFQGQKFWISDISGMGGSFDMEWKGCELIGCWTRYVSLNCDLDP